jgi:NRPS condensation-like uncharacterized protein
MRFGREHDRDSFQGRLRPQSIIDNHSMKKDAFYRRAESLDLIGVCLRPVSNQLLFVILKFSDRINVECMRQAIWQLLEAYPLLACELDIGPRWPAWKKRENTGHLKRMIVRNEDADESRIAEYVSRTRESRSPTVHATLFRGPVTDTLCFEVDHTLADAAGAKDLVYAVADIYAQLDRGRYQGIATARIGRRSHKPILRKFGLCRMLLSLAKWRAPGGTWKFPIPDPESGAGCAYSIRRLPPEAVGHLKRYCKRRKATINDVLVAALYCSLFDLDGSNAVGDQTIQITVDLRRYLTDKTQLRIANLSSSICVKLKGSPGDSFDETLSRTSKVLSKVKTDNPGIGAMFALDLIFLIGFRGARKVLQSFFRSSIQSGRANPFLTNLGKIDDSRVDFGTVKVIDGYLLGPSLLVPGLSISASSFKENLTISAGFRADEKTRTLVERTLDRMVSYLPALPEESVSRLWDAGDSEFGPL